MNDYSTVTEKPGLKASQEQLSMIMTRYGLARDMAAKGDVLEVGCGTGIALGYLAENANSVTAGDIDDTNLEVAKSHCDPAIRIEKIDAHNLEFEESSFDLVLFYEAIYYLDNPVAFLSSAYRVLRPGGKIIISTVNHLWEGFNPSPYSKKYYNVEELKNLLESEGFETEVKVGFLDNSDSLLKGVVRQIRTVAVSLNLIPKTMKGKEWLKAIFMGRLTPLPQKLTNDLAPRESLKTVKTNEESKNYKMLYFVGTKKG